MKKVILLLIVLAALIGVAVITQDQSENRLKPAAAREKLLPDLDVNSVRKVRIKEGDKNVTLAITGDQWGVAERSGYPASFDKLGKMLVDLKDQKSGKQKKYGKGAWADLKLNEPKGDPKDQGAGLAVELLGDGDKPIKTLILGKNVSSSTVGREPSPYGGGGNERYARVNDDGDTVWQVDGQFYDLQPKAEDWVDKSFIDVSKIKEVEVTNAKPEDSWKASRKEEATLDFTLADSKPGEDFDSGKAALNGVLSSPTFTDVLTKDKATADFMKDAVTAKITTFEGFHYTVKLLKKGTGSDEKNYISVTTTGEFPKERPAVKDEKPEDKKKNDDEFAAKTKTLQEKLEREKKFDGWVYEISSYTIGSLLKKRSELMKEKDKAGEGAGKPPGGAAGFSLPGATGSPIGLPPGLMKPAGAPPAPAPAPKPAAEQPKPKAEAPKPPVTVTTPPVSVPATPTPTPPKPELKAPAKDPLPPAAAPAKPAAPSPAPAAPKPEEPKK